MVFFSQKSVACKSALKAKRIISLFKFSFKTRCYVKVKADSAKITQVIKIPSCHHDLFISHTVNLHSFVCPLMPYYGTTASHWEDWKNISETGLFEKLFFYILNFYQRFNKYEPLFNFV